MHIVTCNIQNIGCCKKYPQLDINTLFSTGGTSLREGSFSVLKNPLKFPETILCWRYFLSPEGVPSFWWSPMGSQFDPFLSYIRPRKHFFDFNLRTVIRHFWPQKFFIPRRWTLKGPPMGSQFESFSVLYLTLETFFWFQFTGGFPPFLTQTIFYPPEVDP